MMSPPAIPAWIVHVKTQAKNSHLKAYLARAEKPDDARRLVRERCTLAAIDGVQVEVAGQLDNETRLGLREIYGLEHGGVVRWQVATE